MLRDVKIIFINIWKNSDTRRILIFIFLGLFFYQAIQTSILTFLNRQQFSSKAVNNLCTKNLPKRNEINNPNFSIENKNENNEESKKKSPPEFCEITPEVQFSKVLWFVSDGLSKMYSPETLEHYKDKGVIFTVDVPGPKYSHAIYTSYLTGQLPTNYKGANIKSDHLIKAMNRSPYFGNLTYVGPEWSFLAILGKENYNKSFSTIHIREESLEIAHQHAYPFFFETWEDKRWFYDDILPNLAKSGGSLITHSAIFDHASHGVFRNPPPNLKRLERLGKTIAYDLNELKNWIDRNPDYLLILSSDHGVDDISDGYVLHGYSRRYNEGYVLIYNPRLSPVDKRLDVVDICSSIAKFLKGVDIPADNIGVTYSSYGDDKLVDRAKALQQNLNQLGETAVRRGVGYNKKKIQALVKEEINESTDIKKLINNLENTARGLKSGLYGLVNPPWDWVALHFIVSVLTILFIIFNYNREMFSLLRMSLKSALESWAIYLILLSGLFINVMMWHEDWKGIFDSGSTFFIYQAIIVLVSVFLLLRVASLDGVRGIFSQTESIKRRGLILKAAQLIFVNSILDILQMVLKNLFKAQWKEQMKLPIAKNLMYILLILTFFDLTEVSVIDFLKKSFRYCCYCFKKFDSKQSNYKGKQSDIVHLIISILLVYISYSYEKTSIIPSYYNSYGIHSYFLILLSCCVIYIAYVIIFRFDKLQLLLIPFNIYAFCLLQDTPHVRFMLILFNYQLDKLLLPYSQIVTQLWVENKLQGQSSSPVTSSSIADDDSNKGSKGKVSAALQNANVNVYWNILQQAMILLILNQPFYQFYIGCEERINIDAHPFAGGVGLKAFDLYPNFSAVQMAFEKNFPLLIFVIHFYYIFHKEFNDLVRRLNSPVSVKSLAIPTTIDKEKNIESGATSLNNSTESPILTEMKERRKAIAKFENTKKIFDMNSGLIASLLFLYSNNTLLDLEILLCFITRKHAFEQAFVYVILAGGYGCAFCATFVLNRLYGWLFRGVSLWTFILIKIKSYLSDGDKDNKKSDIVSTISFRSLLEGASIQELINNNNNSNNNNNNNNSPVYKTPTSTSTNSSFSFSTSNLRKTGGKDSDDESDSNSKKNNNNNNDNSQSYFNSTSNKSESHIV